LGVAALLAGLGAALGLIPPDGMVPGLPGAVGPVIEALESIVCGSVLEVAGLGAICAGRPAAGACWLGLVLVMVVWASAAGPHKVSRQAAVVITRDIG